MNKNLKGFVPRVMILTVVAALVVACHGGGSGGILPFGAKAKVTTSKGVITGFGSVFVNGVEYRSGGASVIMDHVSGAETDLDIGMVVTVKGSIDASGTTGSAASITFADSLEGPVSTVLDPASSTLAVMGQTVKVDAATMYQNIANASLLALNDMVEVTGFPDASGVILATRIEKKTTLFSAGTTTVELKGAVSGLAGSLFSINALSIDASGIALPGSLVNGSLVEVRGTLAAASGPMTAAQAELVPSFSASEGEHVEIEGIVTDYASLSSFKVNGVPVDGSALSPVTIADGMKVEVEGTMVGGILVASSSAVELESNVLLEGNVDAAGGGTLTVLGQTIIVSATTEIKDSSAANLRIFGLADIAVNDHVVVVGYQGAGGIIATSVERTDAATLAQLKGIVTAATATTSLTILGIAVDTSAASFSDINSNAVTGAAFFAALTPGTTVVKVKWNAFAGTGAPVDEAELESVP